MAEYLFYVSALFVFPIHNNIIGKFKQFGFPPGEQILQFPADFCELFHSWLCVLDQVKFNTIIRIICLKDNDRQIADYS
jgi:hypothetical protein